MQTPCISSFRNQPPFLDSHLPKKVAEAVAKAANATDAARTAMDGPAAAANDAAAAKDRPVMRVVRVCGGGSVCLCCYIHIYFWK